MKRLLVSALLVLAACATEPNIDEFDIVPVEPLPIYAQWWHEIEECSGRHGDMNRIHWAMLADTSRTFHTQWGKAVGIYFRDDRTIMTVQWARDVRAVVAHEMLHALLPSGGHPPVFDICGVR